MPEHRITIPGPAHGFPCTSSDDVHVVIFDAQAQTQKKTVEASAITVDPVTHDVTLRLASGTTIPVAREPIQAEPVSIPVKE